MTPRSRWWLAILTGAVLLLFAARWIGHPRFWRVLDPFASSEDARSAPSDDDLRKLLRAHHTELEQLRRLIGGELRLKIVGDDRVGDCWLGVDRTWGRPVAGGLDERGMLGKVGLADERYAAYRKLLGAVGAHRVELDADGRVRISLYCAGIVSSGVTKDLVWSPSIPSPLVSDTDRGRPSNYTVNYAALGDFWYVEHSSN